MLFECRGWGGAAREEGDAEEDEDEDTDEEDEDQDQDEDDDDAEDDDASSSTSSCSSVNELPEYLWQNEAAATSGFAEQHITAFRKTAILQFTPSPSTCSIAVSRQLIGQSDTDSGAAASTSCRAGQGDVIRKNYPPVAQAQHQVVVQTCSRTVSRTPFLPQMHKKQHSSRKHKRQKQQNSDEPAPAVQYVLNFAGRFCINVLSYSV